MGYSVIHGYSVINPFLQVGCLARKAEKVERERESTEMGSKNKEEVMLAERCDVIWSSSA